MQHAIDTLTHELGHLEAKIEKFGKGDGSLAKKVFADLDAKAKEIRHAIVILRNYRGDFKAEDQAELIKEISGKSAMASAFINVRDTEDGLIDMDVTFVPEVANDSKAHQVVREFVEYMNTPRAA